MPLYQLDCVDPDHLSRGPAGSNQPDWSPKTATWVDVPEGQSPTPEQAAMAGKCKACARLHPPTPPADRGPMDGPTGTIPGGLVVAGTPVYLAGPVAGTTSVGAAQRIPAKQGSRWRLRASPVGAIPAAKTLSVRALASATPGGAFSPIAASAVSFTAADGTLAEPKKSAPFVLPAHRWLIVGMTYTGDEVLALPVYVELERIT